MKRDPYLRLREILFDSNSCASMCVRVNGEEFMLLCLRETPFDSNRIELPRESYGLTDEGGRPCFAGKIKLTACFPVCLY